MRDLESTWFGRPKYQAAGLATPAYWETNERQYPPKIECQIRTLPCWRPTPVGGCLLLSKPVSGKSKRQHFFSVTPQKAEKEEKYSKAAKYLSRYLHFVPD